MHQLIDCPLKMLLIIDFTLELQMIEKITVDATSINITMLDNNSKKHSLVV